MRGKLCVILVSTFILVPAVVWSLNCAKGVTVSWDDLDKDTQRKTEYQIETEELIGNDSIDVDEVNAYEWFNFTDYSDASILVAEVEAVWSDETKALLMEFNKCAFRTYNALHGMVIDDTIRLEEDGSYWKINCEVITGETVYLARINMNTSEGKELAISSDEVATGMFEEYLNSAYE